MKRRFLLALVPALMLGLTSCSIVNPDGGLKDLVEGDLLTGDSKGTKTNPDERQVKPLESGGPVRWKVEF